MTMVGFIGLGDVGQKLALNLVTSGFDVVVRDADQQAATPVLSAGATWGYSPRDVAEQSDVVITCLGSASLSAAAMEGPNGVLSGLSEGNLWLEMSPTESVDLERRARLVEASGAMVMDTQVTGNPHLAADGNVSILAGGSAEAFDVAGPVLEAMAGELVHTGDLGTASTLAVVSNFLAGIQLAATGEALMVAKRAGIDLGVAYTAIKASGGNSSVHETDGQVILNGSYNSGRTMERHLRDATTFDELGKTLDIPAVLSPLLVQILTEAGHSYGDQAWSSMVVKQLEEACQTDLRAAGFPSQLACDDAKPC